jgi:rfaE bifunctional protein kinase chain/domain
MDVISLFNSFVGKKIVVLGDVMLDSYMLGNVDRISPEAPVPIVNLRKEEDRLGGSANVALNLASLGANPIICSVIGKDKAGKKITELFETNGISAIGLTLSEERFSTVKTRIIGNNQQLLRIDSEQTDDISTSEEEVLFGKIESILKSGVDALIFQDYNKGTLTESLIKKVINLCIELQIPTSVDPKKNNFFAYQGVNLFKPNLKELKEGLDLQFSSNDFEKIDFAVDELRKRLKHEITFITLSENGVLIQDSDSKHHIPAHVRNIADVSGAGDTVISVASLCLAVGLPIEKIAEISNLAGGLVCEKSGVVSIDKNELIQELQNILK